MTGHRCPHPHIYCLPWRLSGRSVLHSHVPWGQNQYRFLNTSKQSALSRYPLWQLLEVLHLSAFSGQQDIFPRLATTWCYWKKASMEKVQGPVWPGEQSLPCEGRFHRFIPMHLHHKRYLLKSAEYGTTKLQVFRNKSKQILVIFFIVKYWYIISHTGISIHL